MNQSSTISFFLIGGFLIYITLKGELPAYAATIGFGGKQKTSPVLKPSSATSPVNTLDSNTDTGLPTIDNIPFQLPTNLTNGIE